MRARRRPGLLTRPGLVELGPLLLRQVLDGAQDVVAAEDPPFL